WGRIMSATATPPREIIFNVRFDAPGADEVYEYLLTFRQPAHPALQQDPTAIPPQFDEEKLMLGSRVLFHQRQAKWLEPPRVVNAPGAGSLMLGAVTGVREITTAHLVLTTGLGYYDFPGSVLCGGGAARNETESGLADSGRNYLQAFTDLSTN